MMVWSAWRWLEEGVCWGKEKDPSEPHPAHKRLVEMIALLAACTTLFRFLQRE